MSGTSHPPNIVVVVLDCVRADALALGSRTLSGMPFLRRFRSQCVAYERAVAPAPWTLPSHASLFTGAYPWEHRAHARGGNWLDSRTPRLAGKMRALGYQTLSFSANDLVSPITNLVDGFQSAYWGGWWELLLRTGRRSRAPKRYRQPEGLEPLLRLRRSEGARKVLKGFSKAAWANTAYLDLGSRIAQRVLAPQSHGPCHVAPWVVPEFSRAVARVPASKPLFGFVNLLDAHEPYYPNPGALHGLTEWGWYLTSRQDKQGWLSLEYVPNEKDLVRLRALYEQAVRSMDFSLGSIVHALQKSGRWENTLFVLTADHGQAFGEHGLLYHGLHVAEPLLRVPLLVRFPGSEGHGERVPQWSSLVDLEPTLLEAAGGPEMARGPGVPLSELRRGRARPRQVLAASEGSTRAFGNAPMAAVSRERFDRVRTAAYYGPIKLQFDAVSEKIQAFDVLQDPGETRDIWGMQRGRVLDLEDPLRRAAAMMSVREGSLDSRARSVEERLTRWGYD